MGNNKHAFLASLFKGQMPIRAISSDFYSQLTPEPLASALDGIRDTALVVLFSYILFSFSGKIQMLLSFIIIWSLFLGIQRTYRGWGKLKRLHQIIEAEKWEIDHHRKSERIELETIYRAKGFEGNLLQEVVDVLMADSNRLLQVMLEEEMGIELESYTHPLLQGFGTFFGALFSGVFLSIGFYLFSPNHLLIGISSAATILLFIYSAIFCRFEKRGFLYVFTWNISIGLFLGFTSYFLSLMSF